MDISAACQEEVTLSAIEGETVRIVESQEQIVTNSLIDCLFPQPAF